MAKLVRKLHFGKIKYFFLPLLLLVLLDADAFSQARRPGIGGERFQTRVKKTEAALPDSVELARRDSIALADSLFRADSIALLSKSSLSLPAFSQARDSIVEDFSGGKKMIYYYGDVTVTYEDMKLTAEYMEYDMDRGTVYARGVYDSLEGVWNGRPVMSQGDKKYHMEELRYNFNSRKSRITNMVTSEDEAILHGRNIKMMEDQSINMTKGKYTVCELEHPHYWLELEAAKVVTKPSRKTVFGPAHLVVEDVHLPFVGLPFGFIPDRPKRATGMLMPSFGEERSRGFYMRDAGMYFVFGDYLDLSLTGSVYSLGSWGLDINSRYQFKYKCNGSFSLIYSNDKSGDAGSTDFASSTNFGINWNHSQDPKSHPGTTFSASVNFSSPSNSKYNSRTVQEALENQISSSISFSKNWNGKVNLSINALHNQNSRDSSYSFTLPNISLSVSTFYPFKRKVRVGKERAYEKISFGYNTSFQNRINFKASEFNQPGFWDKFQNGMSHNFKLGLPSFSIFNYINFSPSVSYSQNWFFRTTDYAYNPETDKVEGTKSKAFSTLGITQSYSASVSVNTRLYGMYKFGSHRKLQVIRHVVSPSMSLSFTPDLRNHANGYRTLDYVDKSGASKVYEYNIYSGQMLSVPSSRKSASASFSIANTLEAKVRDFADTTGTGVKKVKLIDQLNFSGSYDFLRDSMKLSDISMTMSTRLFDKVGVSGGASFSPYAYDEKGRTYNKFAIAAGQGLLRVNSANVSLSYTISGNGELHGNDGTEGSSPADYYQRVYYHPFTGEFIPEGWLYYTNPAVPWSVNFGYSLTYRHTLDYKDGELHHRHTFNRTLSVGGNVKLTKKLSIDANTGYDFVAKSFSTTQLNARYDMHCFNIAISWVPTGTWQSYSFRISANAAALSDLLRFKKSRSYRDNY